MNRSSILLRGLVAAPLVLAALTACGADDEPAATSSSAASSSTTDSGQAPDPCDMLMGDDGLVAQTFAVADRPLDERGPVQEALFDIVVADPPGLGDPAGQLVDFLDDPEAYEPLDGGPEDVVTAARDAITAACS